jgi:Protein of unknown function (DUF2690)
MKKDIHDEKYQKKECSMKSVRKVMQLFRLSLLAIALAVTLFGATALAGFPVASAHAANAQVTCSGNGCNGLDPEKTGCAADAFTVQTAVFSDSYVQLRYSPTCGTNWGRVYSRVGPANLIIRSQRIDGLSYTFSGGKFNYAWSAMVYAPNVQARACGGVNVIEGCTAYV